MLRNLFGDKAMCRVLPAAVLLLGSINSVQAEQSSFNYRYVDVGVRIAEIRGYDGTGAGVQASYPVQDNIRVRAAYQYLSADDIDATIEDLILQVGYILPVNPQMDVVIDAGLIQEWQGGSLDNDDSGLALGATVRYQASPEFEAEAGLVYLDIFDDSDLGFRIAGYYRVNPQVDVLVSYETIFENDIFTAGVRLNF